MKAGMLAALLAVAGSFVLVAPAAAQPHLIRASNGNWQPDAGYVWVDPGSQSNLSVRWEPGRSYWSLGEIKWPHVVAAPKEGDWQTAAGYTWVSPDDAADLRVRWDPGRSYWYLGQNKWPHVVAAPMEGEWQPAPGYTWIDPDAKANMAVRWAPGKEYWRLGSVEWPNVVASSTEGSWLPASGYEWAYLDNAGRPVPGNLAVVVRGERQASANRRTAMETHWADYLKQIQAENAFPNWPGPPLDLYMKRARN